MTGDLDWTPDEQALVLAQTTPDAGTLVRLNLADGKLTPIWPSTGDFLAQAAVSPDGRRIVFVRGLNRPTGFQELWTIGIDGSGLLQLTTGFSDQYPVWTANGQYVAFSRRTENLDGGIYLVPAGGGTAILLVGLEKGGTADYLEPMT